MEECRYCNGLGHHIINDEVEYCHACGGTGIETYDDERLEYMDDGE